MAEPGDQENPTVPTTPVPEQRKGLFGWLRKERPVESDITSGTIDEPTPIPEPPKATDTPPEETNPPEPKPSLTIPSEKVASLIKKKTEGDPAKEAGLLTSARILRPMLEDSSRLGLSEEEQKAVRKYAKSAGEKVSKEIKESTSKNPVDKIDQILYGIASKLHEGDHAQILFTLESQQFRQILQTMQDEIADEQQQRDFDGKPSSFKLVCEDYLARKRTASNSLVGFEGARLSITENSQHTEQILKDLGILGPNHTLKNLLYSERWFTLQNNMYQDVIGGTSVHKQTVPGSSVPVEGLDSKIPGLKVVVYQRKGDSGGKYKFDIRLAFSPEVLTEVLRTPLPQSPFDNKPLIYQK